MSHKSAACTCTFYAAGLRTNFCHRIVSHDFAM